MRAGCTNYSKKMSHSGCTLHSFIHMQKSLLKLAGLLVWGAATQCSQPTSTHFAPAFTISNTDTLLFNSFVDCNMAEAWIGDTFRIFPGKYGHDTLWGNATDLKYACRARPSGVIQPPLPTPGCRP